MHCTRLLLIRHGETAWNVEKRVQGHLDIPLNATGREQAERLANVLKGRDPIDAIYSSDLTRAMQTASAVAKATGAPLRAEPALRERSFGDYEGRCFVDVQLDDPHQAERWRRRDPAWAPPGGGESLVDLKARIVQAVSGLAENHAGQHIAIVTHGGVLDVLYRAATRLDLQDTRTWQLGNAAINRLLWTADSGFSLVGWADVSHLQPSILDEHSA